MSRTPEGPLETRPEIRALRPWYHDFSRLRLRTDFTDSAPTLGPWLLELRHRVAALLTTGRVEKRERLLSRSWLRRGPSSHRLNQPTKERILRRYLERGLGELEDDPRCLDLFCADGYYSCVIAAMRPRATVTGVDLDRAHIERARTAAGALGLTRAHFSVEDVAAHLDHAAEPYGLVLCAGGLYHLRDPRSVLARIGPVAERFLVVQSVVSLENDAEDYFETPAPGWQHGCRFSHARLRRWLTDLGWRVVDETRNELPANPRPCDRGSSYFLCAAPSRTG